jgi:hypothetical protein
MMYCNVNLAGMFLSTFALFHGVRGGCKDAPPPIGKKQEVM